MGVPKFLQFVCNKGFYEDGFYEDGVCLASYAREHARRNDLDRDHVPVLVVDLLNLVRIIYGDLDWICGGQHREFEERLRSFVDRFEMCGIKLVFVMDGSCPEDKFETWLVRREKRLEGVGKVMGELYQDPNPRPNKFKGQKESLAALPCLMVAQVLKSMGCEVICAMGDADKRTSEIADERRAFGILAYDADYLFFPTKDVALFSNLPEHTGGPSCPIWKLPKNGRRMELKSLMIHPGILARDLGIDQCQMPLLASLLGNDIVTRTDLREFHNSLHAKSKEMNDLVPVLCNRVVRDAPPNENLRYFLRQTVGGEDLVSKVLKSVDSYAKPSHLNPAHALDQNCNERGVTSYYTRNTKWLEILDGFTESYEACEASFIVLIMLGHPMQFGVVTEDYRPERIRLPLAMDVYQDLRRRIYGVLLLEKPGSLNLTVDEWAVRGLDCIDRLREEGPGSVMPISPPRELHPGLLTLHSKDPELDPVRWRLFAYCISGSENELRSEILKNMNKSEINLFSTLYVMTRQDMEDCIRDHEIKAFILQHFQLKKMTILDLQNVALKKINPRAVHLATTYSFSWIRSLSWAVGNVVPAEHFLPSKTFDGKLFQYIYGRLHEEGGHGQDRYWQSEFARLDEASADEAESILRYLDRPAPHTCGKKIVEIDRLSKTARLEYPDGFVPCFCNDFRSSH